jgi:dienelactone hydrolase
MAGRNLSTRQFFLDLIRDYEPELTFRGSTRQEFEAWQSEFRQRFLECLGPLPRPVPLAPEVIWRVEEEGLIKEKLLFDTAPFTTVPAILLRPADTEQGRRRAAIVCVHGHGPHGKDPVAGARYAGAESQANLYNYNYGEQMAKQGYVTLCPDTRPFGERSDTMPGERPIQGRDPCNVHAIKAWLLGFNLMAYNLWDLMKCVDLLQSLPYVDPDRIGAMGLSGGGANVMHFAALDPRIRATNIICALNSYRAWAIGIDNFCGTQFLPGIFRYGDHAEICGLICPRPLLVENGGFDYGFPPEASVQAQAQVQRIYRAAGVPERFEVDLGYGGHQYYGNKASAFFARYLGDGE